MLAVLVCVSCVGRYREWEIFKPEQLNGSALNRHFEPLVDFKHPEGHSPPLWVDHNCTGFVVLATQHDSHT